MLTENDSLPFIVIWALARDIDFDRGAVEQALRRIYSTHRAYLDGIGVLSGLLTNSGRGDEALLLLARHRDGFLEADAASAWRHWHVQALSSMARLEEAKAEAREESDPAVHRGLLTVCAEHQYQLTGDWRRLWSHHTHSSDTHSCLSVASEATARVHTEVHLNESFSHLKVWCVSP